MTVRPISPEDPLFDQVGGLFDDYRAHYGQARSPRATRGGWANRWRGGA